MERNNLAFELDESRLGRTEHEGDDDISPFKYYGTILLAIVMFLALMLAFFV